MQYLNSQPLSKHCRIPSSFGNPPLICALPPGHKLKLYRTGETHTAASLPARKQNIHHEKGGTNYDYTHQMAQAQIKRNEMQAGILAVHGTAAR